MEFNILPRAKILSPHSNNKLNQNTTQTVNVIVSDTGERKSKTKIEPIEEVKENENEKSEESKYEVQYKNREVKLEEPAEKLSKEDSISTINFLKLVLESYMNNPIRYNNYIICSVPVLENLIETLTSCEDCNVETEDFDLKCCGNTKNHIAPINKIWCRNQDITELFKYKYSQFLQTFDYYRISLKFVYLE